ncbi:MAG TPA: mechanosensitive ion channel [Anaerohalosphaeraceae bacterium]|nr:mechanosensitive ion channel [Anaerohalosphaeraceae bacterium]
MNQNSRCCYKSTPAVFFFLVWVSCSFGQVLSASTAGVEISEEKVLQYRKAVEQDSSVQGQTRQKLFELYDKALALLTQNKELQSRVESFRQMQASLPEKMEKARQTLAALNQSSGLPSAEGLSIAELEEKLAAARTDWDEARKNAEQVQQEMLRRTQRRAQIPQELLTARGQMDQIKQQMPPLVVPFRAAEPAQATALVSQIQIETFRLQMELLEEEEKAYAAAEALMMLERDVSSRRLAEAERRVRCWEQALQQARLREVQQIQAQAEQAAHQSQGTHPVLQQLLLENAELASLQTERIRQLEENARYAMMVETQLRNVSKDYEGIQTQIARAGQVTSALGVLLVTKKNDLPDLREHRKQIRRRMMESSAVQLEWGKYDRQWSDLADVSGQAAFRLASAGLSERDEDYSALLPKVIELLSRQRELLQNLTASTMQYLTALAQLDIQERALVSTVQTYQRFIEENSFWVKNTSLFSLRDFWSVLRVGREWISGSRWRQIFSAWRQDVVEEWGLHILCAAGWIGLFRCRNWFKKRLRELAQKVSKVNSDRYLYTVYALLLSILSASIGPLVPFYLGWRLKVNSALFPETASLAAGLLASSVCLFVYRFLQIFCAPAGLGEHFRLPADFLSAFRRHIGWYFQILIPLVFVWYLTEDAAIEEAARNGVLRLLFLARQILLMMFLLIVLRPSGFLSSYLHRVQWLYTFRYAWYGLCWLVPLFFCYLSVLGYGFTARQLEQRLQETILFLLAVLFVYGMLIRWLSVLQQSLHLQSIGPLEPAASAEQAAPSKESRMEHSPEWFAHLFGQTRKLINALVIVLMAAGVFWIWRSVLPAFGVLEKVHLWSSSDAQGQVKDITMAGLFRALIITILTVILTRNIPGFLEVSLLRRFPLDAGVRFAITSVSRYVLVIVGILLVSSELGIRWSSIQWLIAALGVGLGFGLQEVFANFICGLLLLLERPLRVGDVVTIGEVTGRVTRIQTRATTIQLWDRKELVVPNREFITGRLINWTLSDTVLRLAFPVGVAYGSDIKKVEQVLYRIARSHPNVIQDDPAPRVVFDSFGDSALQFELRVYIPSMDCLVDVKHQINCAIDEEFRKEGIKIAFPQRDLHIRSIQAPLPIQPSEPPMRS